VAGTPFDFRRLRTIGQEINAANVQLEYGKGYDHNFVLRESSTKLARVATVVGDLSGIKMDIYTDEPGLQFYSGNFMRGVNTRKGGSNDVYRGRFALETQHFPDSPNQPSFPSTTLKPGDRYHTFTVYKFSINK